MTIVLNTGQYVINNQANQEPISALPAFGATSKGRRTVGQALTDIAATVSIARCAGDGLAINVLGAPYVFKAASTETGNSFCCIEGRIPPGSGVPPHTHTHEDEAFYVLAGEIILDSADRPAPLRLGAGSFFFGPRGRQHSFRNESTVEARILVLCLPGAGIEQMFMEMDAAGRRNAGAPAMDEALSIAARAGVMIAAPSKN
jgi:mannose-6-phosphate isomerase-like protein (cupin superfamily)